MNEMSSPPGQVPSPVARAAAGDQVAIAELLEQYRGRLKRMDPLDREILVLRHDEQMTIGNAAAALGLEPSPSSKRYTRALERLKEILAGLPGGISEDGS
jgi:RNA polymerase sigma-70 factor, ECF subfamily